MNNLLKNVGIWLVIIGITQVVHAFQIRREANTAHAQIDAISHRLAA